MDVKNQFVVHLQNHGGLETFALHSGMHINHGQLHDVGSGALNGGVDGISFRMPPHRLVARIDVPQIATSAQQRLHVALRTRRGHLVVDVFFDAGIGREVAVDDFFGFGPRKRRLIAQSKRGHPVNDAKIDRLRVRTLLARHLREGHAKNLGRRSRVNVLAAPERLQHRGILAHGGNDAQFNLRVVGTEQYMVGITGNKEVADATAALRSDRNVLQVRVGGRQAAGRGHCLVEGRVDAARLGVNQLRQGIDVGAFQLAHLAPVEDFFNDGMLLHIALKDFLAGGILTRFGLFHFASADLQAIKEHFTELLGGAQIEFTARQFVYFGLQSRQVLPELLRKGREAFAVDFHARQLHVGQNGNQGRLHGLVNGLNARALYQGLQGAAQAPGDVGIFPGIFGHGSGVHVAHGLLIFAFRAD